MKIEAGIILGSGIDILPFVRIIEKINIKELNLPEPGVEGQSPFYTIGEISGKTTGIFSGRVHLYEGYNPYEVARQVRFLKKQGADKVVLTNASGIVNKRFTPGSIMIIKDQINLTGVSPFDYKSNREFVECTQIYHVKKFKQFKKMCAKFKVKLYLGILAGVRGPEYETPAEVKMLKRIGADAVCMSTVLEAMYAHYLKMDVLGISVLTNYAGRHSEKTHNEVISVSHNLSEVVFKIIELYLR
jgi:purine-nucleoside phosphorylase